MKKIIILIVLTFTLFLSFASETIKNVGTIKASDPEGQKIVYSIVNGNDSGLFNLDSINGKLTMKESNIKKTYYLTVKVTDTDVIPLSSTAIITVKVKTKSQRKCIFDFLRKKN